MPRAPPVSIARPSSSDPEGLSSPSRLARRCGIMQVDVLSRSALARRSAEQRCLPGREGSRMQIDQPVPGQELVNELDVAGEARLYRAMRWFWHPVMYASELTDSPRGAVLLEGPVVLAPLAGEV